MRMRHKRWAAGELKDSKIFIDNPLKYTDRWSLLFGNDAPIYLELGCGKCLFLSEYAPKNPDKNFIAVDLITDILAVAHRNVTGSYASLCAHTSNILLVPYDVTRISNLFSHHSSVDGIYINFPNPWPKERHKKRRLTHPRQLLQYREFLSDEGFLHLKTDDDSLFADSRRYFSECGYKIVSCSDDLLADRPSDVFPPTEHEKYYIGLGKKIKYIKAAKNV